MTSNPLPPPRTASPAPMTMPMSGAGVIDAFTSVLAEMTGVDAERIDPERTFQSFGLDSMLAVEFVSMVNARYGTRIRTSVLQDHATPASLARHLAAELGVPAPRPAPPASGAAPVQVVRILRARLAEILGCPPDEISPDAGFALLGIDSILGAEFVESINRTFGLDERVSLLYDRPDLLTMAAYIASRSTTAEAVAEPEPEAAPAAFAPAPAAVAPAPVPVRVAAPPLTEGEVHALLDAVRDDLISIDEAAALLAEHAA